MILGFLLLISISCRKNDPCDVLVNGVYQFPELPANHGMTSQELQDFLDLPADITECISTPGLVETCMNFPNLMLILAGQNPQSGYGLVRVRFRGVRELEQRPDRSTFLLAKYKTIDPLGYDPSWEPVQIGVYSLFYLSNFEVIFSQYINLMPLTKQEQVELIETAIDVYDKMKIAPETYSLYSLECTATLMGRLMYQNGYEPMVELYNTNYWIFELLEYYGPAGFETVELVYDLAKEYLNHLNNS
jgi:hypothetical protein